MSNLDTVRAWKDLDARPAELADHPVGDPTEGLNLFGGVRAATEYYKSLGCCGGLTESPGCCWTR